MRAAPVRVGLTLALKRGKSAYITVGNGIPVAYTKRGGSRKSRSTRRSPPGSHPHRSEAQHERTPTLPRLQHPNPQRPRCRTCTQPDGYSSSHWQRVRRQRLNLDGHRCTLNHPGCTTVATTVHLAPELNGNHLLATVDNTRSACRRCHGTEDAPRANGYPATLMGGGAGAVRRPSDPDISTPEMSVGDFVSVDFFAGCRVQVLERCPP